jgi:hypothetical protein
MKPLEALQQHTQICDELYTLALEENRFLQQHRRTPEATLLDRKRALLARLDDTLSALRTAPRSGAREPAFKQALDKTRSRILQILQLDKENEELLTRFSMSRGEGAAPASPAVAPGMLQKIYSRHS